VPATNKLFPPLLGGSIDWKLSLREYGQIVNTAMQIVINPDDLLFPILERKDFECGVTTLCVVIRYTLYIEERGLVRNVKQ
jgi:hypothetical protein